VSLARGRERASLVPPRGHFLGWVRDRARAHLRHVVSTRAAREQTLGARIRTYGRHLTLHPMHVAASRKKIAVEFLESEGHAAEEPVPQAPPEPVLEIKIAHFCGETIDEIQQLLCDLGEFLTVEAVDQKGDFARCLSAAIQSHLR
jgi:hypothetical protein